MTIATPLRRFDRCLPGAMLLVGLAVFLSGIFAVVRAAPPEVEIDPVVIREFPQVEDNVVEIYVEVPWTGADPTETAILLELPERAWTHIEFVRSVRNGDRIAALYELDLLGRLVTGVEFHYQWRLTDSEGIRHLTPSRRVLTVDPGYPWRIDSEPEIRVFSYDPDSDFGPRALAEAVSAAELVEDSLGMSFQRQLKVVIYPTFGELYQALGLADESRVKGVWRAGYELIMLQSDPRDGSLGGVLAHEFAHAVLDQNLRNPWRDLPTWVHEGVATWVQAKADADLPYERLLADAHRDDRLRSLRGLQGYLPIDREGASLVYAQSYSMVSYLVDRYGIEELRRMLRELAAGNTEDEALLATYGFNAAGLESEWRQFLDASYNTAADQNPVALAGPADPDAGSGSQLGPEAGSGDGAVVPADTLIGSPELPPADEGTRAFIAITGLTVIALFAVIGFLSWRRSSRQPQTVSTVSDEPPPFALGVPTASVGAAAFALPRAKSAPLPASELARSGRARTGGFGFNRFEQLAGVRPERFAGRRRPRIRRFRRGRG